MFSGRVIKYNRFGMKQERLILLTNLYLSNIKKKRKRDSGNNVLKSFRGRSLFLS